MDFGIERLFLILGVISLLAPNIYIAASHGRKNILNKWLIFGFLVLLYLILPEDFKLRLVILVVGVFFLVTLVSSMGKEGQGVPYESLSSQEKLLSYAGLIFWLVFYLLSIKMK